MQLWYLGSYGSLTALDGLAAVGRFGGLIAVVAWQLLYLDRLSSLVALVALSAPRLKSWLLLTNRIETRPRKARFCSSSGAEIPPCLRIQCMQHTPPTRGDSPAARPCSLVTPPIYTSYGLRAAASVAWSIAPWQGWMLLGSFSWRVSAAPHVRAQVSRLTACGVCGCHCLSVCLAVLSLTIGF